MLTIAALWVAYSFGRKERYEIQSMGSYSLIFDSWTGTGCAIGGHTCFDGKGNFLDDTTVQNRRKPIPVDSLLENPPSDSR